MRNQGTLLLFAVFAAAAFCAAQAPEPGAATKTYHSDAMSFDFVYPASFSDPQKAAENSSGNAAPRQEDAACVTNPVALTDMRTSFNLIFVREYNEACFHKKEVAMPALGKAAADDLSDILSRLGKPVLSSPANYDLEGHNASTVSGTVKVAGATGNNTIHGALSCVSTGKGIACFQFLSNECSNLTALSASTIKLPGTVAAPIIPSGIGAACKP